MRTIIPGAAALMLLLAPATGASGQAATVILVRHAEKALAPAADPPLSASGEARAEALAAALANSRLDAVFVTEYVRTAGTALPAARAHGLVPTVVPVRGDSLAHAWAIAAALRHQPRGATVLIVEHTNTIPEIIHALGGALMPELCAGEYASLFLIDLTRKGKPSVIRGSYGASDAPGANRCAAPVPPK